MNEEVKNFISSYVSELMDREGYLDNEFAICHQRAFTGEDIGKAMVAAIKFITNEEDNG